MWSMLVSKKGLRKITPRKIAPPRPPPDLQKYVLSKIKTFVL